MTSPMLTVVVLAVLWMIVVVPMVLRRHDRRAGERSVARFSAAMRALAARRAALDDVEDSPTVLARSTGSIPTVAVPTARPPSVSTRRPIAAAGESLMYPPDRHEMSQARRRMLTRRRRSLGILSAGTAVSLSAALMLGGTMWWTLTVGFGIGLAGYMWFLRGQALRDRERRETRRRHAAMQPVRDYDATAEPFVAIRSEAVVRIDDDDVELMHLDTIDLTGLYDENEDDVPIRRAG
jgi:hypothetical protein